MLHHNKERSLSLLHKQGEYVMPVTTKQVKLYTYDCLPTDEAKEAARSWWIELELQDPAWYQEYEQSMQAAIVELRRVIDSNGWVDPEDVKTLVEISDSCELTGYCADGLLADYLRKYCAPYCEKQLGYFFALAWEKELEARIEEVELIEDTLLANEYTFNEQGERED